MPNEMVYNETVIPETTVVHFENYSSRCDAGWKIGGKIESCGAIRRIECAVYEANHNSHISLTRWEEVRWLRDQLNELLDKEETPCDKP